REGDGKAYSSIVSKNKNNSHYIYRNLKQAELKLNAATMLRLIHIREKALNILGNEPSAVLICDGGARRAELRPARTASWALSQRLAWAGRIRRLMRSASNVQAAPESR